MTFRLMTITLAASAALLTACSSHEGKAEPSAAASSAAAEPASAPARAAPPAPIPAVVNKPYEGNVCDRVGGSHPYDNAEGIECKGYWNIYASIPNGGTWWEDKDGTDPVARRVQAQGDGFIRKLEVCGIGADLARTYWFDRFQGDLAVVHTAAFRTSAEAAVELAQARACGVKGYTKFSEYAFVGRD